MVAGACADDVDEPDFSDCADCSVAYGCDAVLVDDGGFVYRYETFRLAKRLARVVRVPAYSWGLDRLLNVLNLVRRGLREKNLLHLDLVSVVTILCIRLLFLLYGRIRPSFLVLILAVSVLP